MAETAVQPPEKSVSDPTSVPPTPTVVPLWADEVEGEAVLSNLFDESSTTDRNVFSKLLSSRVELIQLQQADPRLKPLFDLALNQSESTDGRSTFFCQDGVLLRRWRDKTLPNLPDMSITQVVAPSILRNELLHLAHDVPSAAHLGVAKTKSRTEQHFYWQTIDQDVKSYVKTCDICQRVGKMGRPHLL